MNTATVQCLRLQQIETAMNYAQEALSISCMIERQGEAAIAEAVLAVTSGDVVDGADNRVPHLQSRITDRDQFGARVRTFVEQVVAVCASPAAAPRPQSPEGAKTQDGEMTNAALHRRETI